MSSYNFYLWAVSGLKYNINKCFFISFISFTLYCLGVPISTYWLISYYLIFSIYTFVLYNKYLLCRYPKVYKAMVLSLNTLLDNLSTIIILKLGHQLLNMLFSILHMFGFPGSSGSKGCPNDSPNGSPSGNPNNGPNGPEGFNEAVAATDEMSKRRRKESEIKDLEKEISGYKTDYNEAQKEVAIAYSEYEAFNTEIGRERERISNSPDVPIQPASYYIDRIEMFRRDSDRHNTKLQEMIRIKQTLFNKIENANEELSKGRRELNKLYEERSSSEFDFDTPLNYEEKEKNLHIKLKKEK